MYICVCVFLSKWRRLCFAGDVWSSIYVCVFFEVWAAMDIGGCVIVLCVCLLAVCFAGVLKHPAPVCVFCGVADGAKYGAMESK